MGLFNNFPYLDLSNLNLDFVLKKLKDLNNYVDSAAQDAETAVNAKNDAVAAKEAAQLSAENAALSEENAERSAESAQDYAEHIADPVGGLVTGWLDDNITPTTPPVDASLSIQGAAADAKATGDAINDVIAQIHEMPHAVKIALDNLVAKSAYADDDIENDYAVFHAWATNVTVLSISAVYTQNGIVFNIDDLNTLKPDLVVTALFSDGTSANVTSACTLSGTLTPGVSVVTASYGGKNASFNVNVTEGVEVTPALSSFVPVNNTSVTVDSANNTIRVYSTANQTYGGANYTSFAWENGYTYRVSVEMIYVSGVGAVGFRDNPSSSLKGGSTGSKTASGSYMFESVLSTKDCSNPCGVALFATMATSTRGDVTYKNLRIVKYMAESEG